jgi:20S proteasome subunit beta 3
VCCLVSVFFSWPLQEWVEGSGGGGGASWTAVADCCFGGLCFSQSILEYNGGAVIAMKGKKCVAIASDTRLGAQAITLAFDKPKVSEISERVFLGCAGLATDNQTFLQTMQFHSNLYKLREGREMSPRVFSNLCQTVLYEKRFGPYFVEPVVAGLDEKDEPFIDAMDLLGANVESPEDFVLTGTSSESLYGMAETLWRKDLEPEELFEVISQCLLSAVDRDAMSGWGAVVHIM